MKNVRAFSSKLMLQMGLAITIMIFLIEGVILAFSIQSRRAELNNLRITLEEDVRQKAGKNYHDLHPTILNQIDIQDRMDKFTRNVALMTILISLVVVAGTLLAFHIVAGRHILKAIKLNRSYIENKNSSPQYFPLEEVPDNELKELLSVRNEMLKELKSYQNGLEDKLIAAKSDLLQAAKLTAIGEMTSSLAHDIKNPLSTLKLDIRILQKKHSPTPEQLETHLGSIEDVADHIHELVDRMGRFVRKSDGIREVIDLQSVIDQALALASHQLKANGVNIKNDIPEVTIFGDSIALQQVFTNLFVNAAHSMKETSEKNLFISITETDSLVKVSINDTGEGISKENQKKIFDSFFTTKKPGEGTGLGLSSALSTIKAHKGSLSLDSIVGKGTTFFVEFPKG